MRVAGIDTTVWRKTGFEDIQILPSLAPPELKSLMRSVEDLMVFSCFGSDDPQHSPVCSLRKADFPHWRTGRSCDGWYLFFQEPEIQVFP
jgi:hypothetical protein